MSSRPRKNSLEEAAESTAFLEYSNKRGYFIDLLMTINQRYLLLIFLVRGCGDVGERILQTNVQQRIQFDHRNCTNLTLISSTLSSLTGIYKSIFSSNSPVFLSLPIMRHCSGRDLLEYVAVLMLNLYPTFLTFQIVLWDLLCFPPLAN